MNRKIIDLEQQLDSSFEDKQDEEEDEFEEERKDTSEPYGRSLASERSTTKKDTRAGEIELPNIGKRIEQVSEKNEPKQSKYDD